MLVLVAIVMLILDAMIFEAVAEISAELGKRDLLLTAAASKVPEGTGSKVVRLQHFGIHNIYSETNKE